MGEKAQALRLHLREMLAELLPDDWSGPFSEDPEIRKITEAVCRRLAEERLLTIDWPEEYGGSDASHWEQAVLREEMWAHFEPRGAQYMGLSWVGPTIMHFGTEHQRSAHLSPIAAGDVIWCQGFSEPESGSDLSSLSLPAVADGDGWRIDGQKIWTSYAPIADWCFLAARTSRVQGNNRLGITIFLVPMTRQGISVRPIHSMMGKLHLNEVFFDDLQVGPDDVLGEVDGGWQVIKYVLAHERLGIPRYARDHRILSDLSTLRETREGASARDMARLLVQARVARLLSYRAIDLRQDDALTDLEASTARLASIRLDQDVAEFALDVCGPAGLAPTEESSVLGYVEDIYRYARSATIASGTIEIQRMLVAKALMDKERSA